MALLSLKTSSVYVDIKNVNVLGLTIGKFGISSSAVDISLGKLVRFVSDRSESS